MLPSLRIRVHNANIIEPYNWSQKTAAGILEDETYLGHTINLKSTTVSFKDKKRIERPKSEQLRFENTHEALVTQQTWEIVQDIHKHKRRRANMAELSSLDFPTAWTAAARWYCIGRTPWMR